MAKSTNNIAKIRKERGLSQQQLAEKVGAHAITISNLERGEAPLGSDWLDRIAEALHVDPGALLLREPPMKIYIGGELSRGIINLWEHEDDVTEFAIGYSKTPDIPADIPRWLIIRDDSLYPAFKSSDAVRIYPILNTLENDIRWAQGRLGIVITAYDECHVGYLSDVTATEVSVDPISGPPVRKAPYRAIYLIDRAIFGPTFPPTRKGKV